MGQAFLIILKLPRSSLFDIHHRHILQTHNLVCNLVWWIRRGFIGRPWRRCFSWLFSWLFSRCSSRCTSRFISWLGAFILAEGIDVTNVTLGLEFDHLTAFPDRLAAEIGVDSGEHVVFDIEFHCEEESVTRWKYEKQKMMNRFYCEIFFCNQCIKAPAFLHFTRSRDYVHNLLL